MAPSSPLQGRRCASALWVDRGRRLRLRNFGIAGISGAIVSLAFTLFITGFGHFQAFAPVVLAIGAISGISGSFFSGSNTIVLLVLGGVIALACCAAILLFAVSNI